MKLSILICSLTSRKEKLLSLLKLLGADKANSFSPRDVNGCQACIYDCGEFEIITATDNKLLPVGAKRNLLVSFSTGEYISFIDDDDIVASVYVKRILENAATGADVIVFDAVRYHNGKLDRTVKYGIEYGHDSNTVAKYFRIPNHLMCVKRSIALQVPFKEVNFGEDADYAQRLLPLLKTQERINEVLYEYWFDDKLTETANRK